MIVVVLLSIKVYLISKQLYLYKHLFFSHIKNLGEFLLTLIKFLNPDCYIIKSGKSTLNLFILLCMILCETFNLSREIMSS